MDPVGQKRQAINDRAQNTKENRSFQLSQCFVGDSFLQTENLIQRRCAQVPIKESAMATRHPHYLVGQYWHTAILGFKILDSNHADLSLRMESLVKDSK